MVSGDDVYEALTERGPSSMTQPTQKTVPIRNGRGEVTGYITVYWSEVHRCYFTVPGRD